MKSSSSTINILLETKKEYTTEVVKILSPFMIKFYETLYRDVCKQNKMAKYLLKEFQIELKQVSSMSDAKKSSLHEIIKEKYEWIDTLIRSIFVIRGQLITAMNHKNKAMHIKPIASIEFIYKCYLEFARELWKQPNIYYHKLSISERQKNLHNLQRLAEHCIHEVIRDAMPFKDVIPFEQIDAIETSDDYTKVYYNEDHDNEYESSDDDDEDNNSEEEEDGDGEVEDDDEDNYSDRDEYDIEDEKSDDEVDDGDGEEDENEDTEAVEQQTEHEVEEDRNEDKEDVEQQTNHAKHDEDETGNHDNIPIPAVNSVDVKDEDLRTPSSPRDDIQDQHYDADIDEVNKEVIISDDNSKVVDEIDQRENEDTDNETNDTVLETLEDVKELEIEENNSNETKVIEIDFNKRVMSIEDEETTPVYEDIKTINIDNEFF